MKPKVIVISEENKYDGNRKQIALLISPTEQDITPQEMMTRIQKACYEYAVTTKEGHSLAEQNGNMLTWDNFLNDIPANFLSKYGLRLISANDVFFETVYEEPLFFNEETCL